jgi:hypothetical protein
VAKRVAAVVLNSRGWTKKGAPEYFVEKVEIVVAASASKRCRNRLSDGCDSSVSL